MRKAYLERMSIYGSPAHSDADFQQVTPLTVRVREACRLTGIGRSKLYELIAADEIETIKVGTFTLIPLESLEQFLKRRSFG
jgi:excisionase family DNA binding protein